MTSLKHTFDKNAAEYRRFRPTYPSTLADDVVSLTSLQNGAHILEIGCGAGQATCLFSGLHPTQTCIDIGPNLIEQCLSQFRDLRNYEFICSSLEDFDGPIEGYDLIYAATCFHWLTPGRRFLKTSAMLKSGGHLAVFSHKHLKNRDGFFAEVQECYKRHAPELIPASKESTKTQEVPEDNPLKLIAHREYDRELRYTADEYVGLLKTFSDHIALGDDRLQALCDSIHHLICRQYEGTVVKTLSTRLKLYEKAQHSDRVGGSYKLPSAHSKKVVRCIF